MMTDGGPSFLTLNPEHLEARDFRFAGGGSSERQPPLPDLMP
jgi:hypothetical protein